MSKKDVVYIDIEDDITAIIEKATSSKNPITALVLPKRYAVLQSLVNMKLLKKAVDNNKKKIVLITSEATLLPVAGAAGVHVADTLQSRPEVPAVSATVPLNDNVIDESEEPIDKNQTVEQAQKKEKPAKESKEKSKKKSEKKQKTEEEADEALEAEGKKIPNFGKFKNKIVIGIVAFVVLIVGWIVGYVILPSAEVSIKAQTTRIDTDLAVTLDEQAESDDISQRVLKSETQEIVKTSTLQFEATGEKDVGNKASGTIEVTNFCFNPGTLPSGTTFTAASGLKFVSTQAVSIPTAVPVLGDCTGQETVADVPVRAQNSGDQYNLAPTTYQVASFSSSDMSGFGSQMNGGTTEVVKVVSQDDFNKAQEELKKQRDDETRSELSELFDEGAYLFEDTFKAKPGKFTSSPAVGERGSNSTMSAEFTYSITGVNRESLENVLKEDQQEKVSSPDQSILETGLDDAVISVSTENGSTVAQIKTNGFAGPEINVDSLKEEIKGKNYGEAIDLIRAKEGVRDVEMDLSPFWVFSVPGRTSKINITIDVSDHTLQ